MSGIVRAKDRFCCAEEGDFCCRLMSNMVIYMTRIMGYEPAFASVQLMLFEGTCYLTPILGAWLADSAWGRFKTILVFSIIYFIVSPQPLPAGISLSDSMPPVCSQTLKLHLSVRVARGLPLRAYGRGFVMLYVSGDIWQ